MRTACPAPPSIVEFANSGLVYSRYGVEVGRIPVANGSVHSRNLTPEATISGTKIRDMDRTFLGTFHRAGATLVIKNDEGYMRARIHHCMVYNDNGKPVARLKNCSARHQRFMAIYLVVFCPELIHLE